MNEEVDCFIDSQLQKWVDGSVGWGLVYPQMIIRHLGINKYKEFLIVAKFVSSNGDNVWHGYPADYVRNSQDRPSMGVLTDWRGKGIIEKHQVLKIRKGILCNL